MRLHSSWAGLVVVMTVALGGAIRAEEPATLDKARAVLDLSSFPIPPDAEARNGRRLAGLTYEVKGDVAGAFAFVKSALLDARWTEGPGAYSSEQSASANYAREGFRVSVTVFAGSKPGTSAVSITNHGDLDVKSLPEPEGAKPLYETPISIAFLAPGNVEATSVGIADALRAQGWEPYGEAGDVRFFKRNAVRLTSRVTAAPAQGGKTLVDYSCELMSADLPSFADFVRAQYADSTKELSFDVGREPEAVFHDYTALLTKRGWEPITDAPTKELLGEALRYRNSDGDLLTLYVQQVDGLSRGRLRHQSAAEVEAMLAANRAKAEGKMKAAPKPRPKVQVSLPKDARDVVASTGRIEFKADAGQGKVAAETILNDLTSDGWESVAKALEGPAGAAALKKDSLSVSISYTDVGFGDAEITVDAIGADLTRKP